jgi:hypothetical protein
MSCPYRSLASEHPGGTISPGCSQWQTVGILTPLGRANWPVVDIEILPGTAGEGDSTWASDQFKEVRALAGNSANPRTRAGV